MRGYISFLLVFAGVAIILAVLSTTTRASINYSKAIELQKVYYLELDIKNTLLDLAKQGANRGAKEYIAEEVAKAAITRKPLNIDVPKLKERARKTAFEDVKLLGNFDYGEKLDVKIWCGFPTFSDLYETFAQKMVDEKRALMCDDCNEITEDLCEEFILIETPDIDFENPLNSIVEIKLVKPGSNIGVVGVSIYSKNNVSSISYVPVGEKR